MLSRLNQKALVLLLCLVTQSSAQNITASSCIASSAYTQCYNQANADLEVCLSRAGLTQDAILACACVAQLDELNCAMANCWNVVYGCEYQTLAYMYTANCASPVPFYPAPDNAPGGCSCNLGYVQYNSTNIEFEYKDCIGPDVSQNDGCTCCVQAAGYAALYGICPNTSPSYIPYSDDTKIVIDIQSPNLAQGQCASDFATYDCSSLGFTGLGVPFMTSLNSATIGTQSISNTNTRTLTSPASGATFTWTDLNIAYTIVAASANGRAASGTASSSSKGGASATAATTGSGAASSATGTKSDARSNGPPQVSVALLMLTAALTYAVI